MEWVDDAIVPVRIRTPLQIVERDAAHDDGWELTDGQAELMGRELGRRASGMSIRNLVNTLRRVFTGWRLNSIVIAVECMCLQDREAVVLVGLVAGWSVKHIAEFLALLYWTDDDPRAKLQARRVLEGLGRRIAVQVITHIQSLLLNNTNVNNTM